MPEEAQGAWRCAIAQGHFGAALLPGTPDDVRLAAVGLRGAAVELDRVRAVDL